MKRSTMKKIVKIIAMLLIVITLVSFTSHVFAAGSMLDPKDLENKIEYGETNELTSKVGKIMGMIRNISIIAAVIVIMVIGVKYILGSVEEKAEYKKTFMPLIIGIILVVAATTIASFLFNIMK